MGTMAATCTSVSNIVAAVAKNANRNCSPRCNGRAWPATNFCAAAAVAASRTAIDTPVLELRSKKISTAATAADITR